jgi:ABC-type phosphate transport system ATPase subunit
VSTYYASTCRECAAACGIIAETREGRVTKLEGNPAHPLNRGALCARGQSALQGLYNPDRFRGPMMRQGGRLVPTDWNTAIRTLSAWITEARGRGPAGTVFIDGVDVRHIPLHVLRGAIGFVNQEPFLFSTTLAENVAFGARASEGDRERVSDAAAIARLDKDLPQFPHGYDTTVGERGITLSGGQKQRVAIARALAIDPQILVLDDALSAVDTHTEEEILDRLSGVLSQRTALVVSHRVSTIRGADQIVVLHEGRVAERGTHDELIRRDGFYADLYRKQLLEEELKAS